HRLGEAVDSRDLPRSLQKALDQNRQGPTFVDTFGKRELTAYVGFADLAGYSTTTSGLRPREIRDYIYPFLTGLLESVAQVSGLVDKTIGDEVMFIVSDPEEQEAPSVLVQIAQLLGFFHNFAYREQERYRFRISVSFGKLYLDRIETSSYHEWSLFGEPLHIAKRLLSLSELSESSPVLAAIGCVADDASANCPTLAQVVGMCTAYRRRWTSRVPLCDKMKGVGEVLYQVIDPVSQNH
ncbi:MAG: hypothetical protein FVQ80_14815, partial [Planctomycetes bacterium]|nr:hypothetical protein [Planctomycetota bacterium]